MKAGNKKITQGAHVPTPSKAIWQANSNSSLGNIKGHYDVVFNTLPRCELMVYSEWWWTGSCEYSDIVYGVDSWAEMKHPDMTASNTNPFLQVYPDTPLARGQHGLRPRHARRRRRLSSPGSPATAASTTCSSSFARTAPTCTCSASWTAQPMTRGYRFKDVIDSCRRGTPALMNSRTYPRINSYEQVHESRPWYTKTGRLEFYRPEVEFIEAGENLIVHREPSDSTFYEPCVIVGAEHPALKPKRPADWGFSKEDLSHMTRQMRNETLDVEATLKSKHPLLDREYRHIFHTPKYRHGSHTTPIDTDYMQLLFGPFGDIHRRDKRMPGIGEMYVDIHPEDAKALGVQDGDYVWIDGDPADLPFRGWQNPDRREEYKVARLMARARYYPGTPRGVTRMWFNGYMATPGSVEGHETREDGLAKNPETNYQSMFRYGGHQSLTRTWLKPTHQTQTLVYRALFGHVLGSGFAPDVHCVGGAPREAMAKIHQGRGPAASAASGCWRPVQLGFRPSVESERMKRYLEGKLGS
jgi:nitrate reductase / nitrite oxidoreductase, alpha subunit